MYRRIHTAAFVRGCPFLSGEGMKKQREKRKKEPASKGVAEPGNPVRTSGVR